MENSDLLNIVFKSSLIASIVSIIITSLINIWLKKLDYRNDFFKILIEKRLEAYKYLENQIAVLKGSTIDNKDDSYYHLIFEYGIDKFFEFQKNLFAAQAYSIWIENDTLSIVNEFNNLFYKIGDEFEDDKDLVERGKSNYTEIKNLRTKLEKSVRNDLLKLYKINSFKKLKNIV